MTDDTDQDEAFERLWDASVLSVLIQTQSTIAAHHRILDDVVRSVSNSAPPEAIDRMQKQLAEAKKPMTGAIQEIQRLVALLNARTG